MIRGGILNSRAGRAWPAAARALAGALAALGVAVAAAGAPALASQRSGGPAASHAPEGATGPRPAAGRMSPGDPWAHVAAGGDASCGIRTDGTLWCWGAGSWGQLGRGSLTDQDQPRQVTTPAAGGWASITAGTTHTCATRTDSTLWCWGNNDSGQLGLGGGTTQDLPRQVTTPATTGWASVTAGGENTCATRTDSTLWCWGNNGDGQLGLGNHTNQDRPRQVTS